MNEDKRRLDTTIKSLQKQIEDENARLKHMTHGKREETQSKLDKAIEECRQAEDDISRLKADGDRLLAEQNEAQTKGKGLQQELNTEKSHIDHCKAQVDMIARREQTKLAPFGSNLEQVHAEIPKMRWHGRPPVGPLGQYVKVRDARWAPLLRVRLGGGMAMFAVTDPRDRQQLDALLKRHGK